MDLDVDVVDFLTKLGIKNIRVRGNEVGYSCPFPGHSHGDKNPSADMRADTTQFKCWGCGESGNAVTFLSTVEGVPPHVALAMLEEEYGSKFKEPTEGSIRKELDERFNDVATAVVQKRKPTDADLRATYINWAEVRRAVVREEPVEEALVYMFERGFTVDEMTTFEIGFDNVSGRISIPWRNAEGDLVGFKGRAWWQNAQPRYITLGGEDYDYDPFEVGAHLFGLPQCLDSKEYQHQQEIIVVEGELNTMAMSSKRSPNTVGFSGRWLSAKQVGLLKRYAKSVILINDDQEDAVRNARMLHGTLSVRIAAPHEWDPADAHPAEIVRMIRESTSSLYV